MEDFISIAGMTFILGQRLKETSASKSGGSLHYYGWLVRNEEVISQL